MARTGFWPTNLRRQPVSVTGVDEVTRGFVGAIERAWSRGMSGISGTFIGGTTADPVYRFNGYGDYVTLANTSVAGASRNLRGDPNVALPNSNGPVTVAARSPIDSVKNQLAQNTPGLR